MNAAGDKTADSFLAQKIAIQRGNTSSDFSSKVGLKEFYPSFNYFILGC